MAPEFLRTRKIEFGRCLEPTMQCGQPEFTRGMTCEWPHGELLESRFG